MRSSENQAQRYQRIMARDRSSRSRATVLNEALEPRRLFAAVAWDGGGDNSNWHDANNWSTNQVPGPADDVTLNVTGNAEVVVRMFSTASVHSINCMEFLSVYGTLNVAAPSNVQGLLNLRGTLGGDGDLTFGTSGSLMCGAGGQLSGSGRVTITPLAQMNVSGNWTLSRALTMDGNCRWDSGTISMNGGTINNGGTWHCGYAPAPTSLVMRGTAGSNAFNNVGNFLAEAGNTSLVSAGASMPFYNYRPAHVTGGNFAALSGGANLSDITIDQSNLTLTLGGNQEMSAASRITGAGRLQLTGNGRIDGQGTINVGVLASNAADALLQGSVAADRVEVNGGHLALTRAATFATASVSGGQLMSDANLVFGTTLDWTGGIIGGRGDIIVASAAQMNVSGPDQRLLNGNLTVFGTAVWTDGAFLIAGTLGNSGMFRIEPTSAPLTMRDGWLGGVSRFINNGTLFKDGSAGSSVTLDVAVNQNASVNVEQGELKFARGANYGPLATVRGGAGATVALAGAQAFTSNTVFNNLFGTLRIDGGNGTYNGSLGATVSAHFAGGTFTLGGALPRTLQFTGGTGVINGNGTIDGGMMSAGAWLGGGNVTIDSNFSWTGGTIGGTGTLATTAPDSLLEISGPDVHRAARPMVLRGYTNWLGGDIDVAESGSIRNEGNFGAMNGTGTVRLFRSGGGAAIVNTGTFAKFFGGAARVETPFNNAGLVTVPGGAIVLGAGGVHAGDFDVAPNATLELGAGHNLGTASTFTGGGMLRLAGAIVDVDADQAFDGTVFVAAGSSLMLRGQRTQVREFTVEGDASIAVGGSRVLSVRSLDVKPDAMLDIADNAVIVDYSGSSPIDAIRTALRSGYANGLWSGTGIRSSTAAAQPSAAVGYAEASDIATAFPPTFAGEAIDATAVVMRLTLRGDANLDGRVNLLDFNRLAGAFGQSGRGWASGDCNYDGAINLSDFNALAANFGRDLLA